MEAAREQRGHFNIIGHETGFKADIYLAGDDPLHKWGMAKAKRYEIGTDTVVVAPPEYVILRKLEWLREGGSDKHIRDIKSILKMSGGLMDFQELERLAKERGLQELWAGIQDKA